MIVELKQMLYVMGPRNRKRLLGLQFLSLLSGVLQMIGVGAVVPFMAVAASPESIHTNKYLSLAYTGLQFGDPREFLITLGVLMFFALSISNAVLGLTEFYTSSVNYDIGHDLECRLFSAYLYQPYHLFLSRNPNEFIKNIVSEVQAALSGFLSPLSQIVTKISTSAFLLALVFLADPMIALSSVLVLGIAYIGIYTSVRKRLEMWGVKRLAESRKRFIAMREAFGSIKVLRLLHREEFFLSHFSEASKRLKSSVVWARWLSSMPRRLMETLTFGGIILIVISLTEDEAALGRTIPLLSLYALCGLRLLPAFQAVYRAVSSMRMSLASVRLLYDDITGAEAAAKQYWDAPPSKFEAGIELTQVNFAYAERQALILNDVNIHIPRNSCIAFAGPTGAGKTTLVDVVIGLLQPTTGCVKIDGEEISTENVMGWQKIVGYVPQDIYLGDSSIRRNIALGCGDSEIDADQVEEAAKAAKIHEFIVNELPEGYDTVVGERGVRLSGGQRQRLGLARALYFDPSVLVLDEATSALDGATETAVMKAINGLSGSKTIIIIAHRLTTLKNCDQIYLLNNGSIVASGTYDELWASNKTFREFAGDSTEPVLE